MDYQNGIIGMIPDGAQLLGRAQEIIALLRDRGARIGYVRVGFADGEAPSGTMGKRLGPERHLIVLSDLCADPDPEVHDFLLWRIFPRQAEVVISAELRSRLS